MATATGIKQLLGAAVTDTTLAKVYDDAILTTGSLMLCDAGFSVAARSAFGGYTGIPANGSDVVNVADTLAATTLGVSAAATHPTLSYTAAMNDGATGKMERGASGTLHGMVRQATAIASTDYTAILAPTALLNYLAANPTHHYYWSIWVRVTRATTVAANVTPFPHFAELMKIDQTKGLGMLPAQIESASYSATGATVDGTNRGAPGVVGDTTVQVGLTCGTTAFTAADLPTANLAQWGAALHNAGILAKLPSFAFQRCYLEDLTVSGRTYAAVKALDDARQAVDVAVGGKFNADTYSSPATVVP